MPAANKSPWSLFLKISKLFHLKRQQKIIQLALPMMTGMLSTNLIMLVDLAMVGLTGTVSIAAAGITGFVIYTASAAFYGLSAGIQSSVAYLVGQKKPEKSPFYCGLIINSILACILIILLYSLSPAIVSLFSTESAVQEIGIPFLRWRLFGLLGLAIFSCFRGYWYAIKKPYTYLKLLILTQVLNGFLNAVFMFGYFGIPEQGAVGAAIASTLSIYIGLGFLSYQGFKEKLFTSKALQFKAKDFFTLGSTSTPLMIQEFFFALSYTTFIAMIGSLGAPALAIANVLITIILVIILPGKGLGSAAITLIGQSLGAQQIEEAKRWNLDICILGALLFTSLSAVTAYFAQEIVALFLQEKQLIHLATILLRLNCISLWLEVVGMVMKDSLVGAKKTQWVLYLSMSMQWLVFLPGVALICFVFKGTLSHIWVYDISFQVFQSILFLCAWLYLSKKL